jgi:hypothetical protein
MKIRTVVLIYLLLLTSGCAILHRAQISDIQYKKGYDRVPFEVKVSEVGFDVKGAGDLAGSLIQGQGGENAQSLGEIMAYFQMGPVTGIPVYNRNYADKILELIYKRCPSGNYTGLTSIRETNAYPVVSGEIVKIKGYCLIPKKA